MSLFTLFMTFPQVWIIWATRQAAGVSVVSWSAYLLSAILWLIYGLQKRDKNIYLPCIGWILLDCAVIVGVVVYS
ncbi:MAG TPA: SemiSWEET family transporter [Fimbriimonadales bacterium]|nr:SemiSWEET family transporter [Fimbriimonadales bacterium]